MPPVGPRRREAVPCRSRRSSSGETAVKRLLFWFLLIALLPAAAGVLVLTRVDTGFVAATIADAVETATGAPVTFTDPPHLSLFPLGVDFGRLAWQQERPGRTLAVNAAGGHARIAFSPLLSGNIVVEEIQLNAPSLDMTLHDAPMPAENGETTAPGTPDAAAPTDELPLELGRVQVKNAHIRLTDAAGNRTEISDLHLSLTDVRRHADTRLETGFAYALRQDGRDISGGFALRGTVRYHAPNLTIRDLQVQIVPRSGPIPAGLGALTLQADAALNLADRKLKLPGLALSCASGRLELAGEANLREPTFAGTISLHAAPRTAAACWGIALPAQDDDRLELSAGLECSRERIVLRSLKGVLDTTRLEGTLALTPQRPALRGELRLGDIRLDRYLPRTSGGTAPQSRTSPAANAVHPTEKEGEKTKNTPPPPAWPELDVALAASSLYYEEMGIKDLHLMLRGEKGRYALNEFSCSLPSGGRIQADGTTDPAGQRHALKLRAESVDIGGLTRMLGKGSPAEGKADLTADVSAGGLTVEAVLASLDGKGTLDVQDLHLKALSALPRNIPGVSGAIPDRITRVQVPFVVHRGEMTAKPIVASADTLNARGQATASLPRRHLHATADVRTPGLTIPVIIDGPFDNLSYTVDPQFLARMAANLPGALLEGGTQTGKAAEKTAESAGSAIDKTIRNAGGLVRGILGR